MTTRLLILNCYSRNALAVINSAPADWHIIGADAEKPGFRFGRPDRYFRSARLAAVIRYPDPKAEPEAFADRIAEICRQYEVDLVIPTGTTTTNCLSEMKERVTAATGAKLAVEDFARLGPVTDKWHAAEIARKAGTPIPRTALFDTDPATLEGFFGWSYPVVVKPRISFAAHGVEFFDDAGALRRAVAARPDYYAARLGDGPALIIQEAVDGDLHDVVLCAYQGEIVAAMTQARVVSLYDFGGGGIINLTTDEKAAIELVRPFVREVGWNGLALFDMMRARDGSFVMIECNPKVWGTTELTTRAGINMVRQHLELFASGEKPAPLEGYRVGLLYRYWLPECLFHLIHKPLTPGRFLKRLKSVLSRHGARWVEGNLRPENIRHLIGLILNKAA
ncbi:ATP-grasp domain-containing protein [Oceanibacterium hippocampi]|uniref:Carbamoyl phosphate synthase-like protein n=1 Tax=Oceanibacterium hippocampi TaxID=745714 RepID=A0A1Y5RQI5_9PROT|nr:ATP-grasp domain-containing protein [Oceanibacterium hippocampi]SLN22673.1 carbamoyl phosphate synthase-like protein [Oceanibacterium hippocampi]